MALEDDIILIKELNAEIKQLYRDLNRTDRPPIFEPDQIEAAKTFTSRLKEDYDEVNVSLDSMSRSLRANVQEMSKSNTELGRTRSAMKSISKTASEIAYINSENGIIEEKTLQKLEKKAALDFKNLKFAILSGDLSKADEAAAQSSLDQQGEFLSNLKSIRDRQVEIKKDSNVKLFTGLEEIAKAIPGLSKFAPASDIVVEAKKDLEKEEAKKPENIQRKKDIESLQSGKGLTKEKIKELGLEKKLVDKKGKGLSGNAAAAKAQSLGGEKLLKPLDKQAGIFQKLGKTFSLFTTGLKALIPALMALIGPLAIINELFTAFKAADKATGELAKGMNITFEEASKVRGELTRFAALSNDSYLTTIKLQKSLMAINSSLGTSVDLAGEELAFFTKLREQAGLTDEEAMGTYKLRLLTGKSQKDITGDILASAKVTAANNKVLLNDKDILKAISKTSAATQLSLSGSATALGEALATAKSLGMTMEQLDSTMDSLLNFESSITSELQAELLLNKDLNLERARLAALNNNYKVVAEEISSQIGDSADFAKLNRIQQEAIAKAAGMTRESLAKTLMEREMLVNLSKEDQRIGQKTLNNLIEQYGVEEAQRMIKEEGIKDLMDQTSKQEDFNAAVEKMKEIFIAMEPGISAIASLFIGIFQTIGFILSPLTAMLGWIKSFSPFLASLVSLVVGLGVAFMIVNGFATAGIGIAISLAAIATGMAGIKAVTADDMMSGAPGYGKRALYDEGELTLLNDKDTIIAGTDLFKPALANDMIAGNPQIIENTPQIIENTTIQSTTPQIIENTTIQPVNQNQNTSMEVSQLKAENAAIKQESRKTNNLLENLISATKANKTVEMEDAFAPLYS